VRGLDWDGDPTTPGGPRNWAPILYVCHSVYGSSDAARGLLARGADPNATFENEYGDMSALYGAAGVLHDPELTRVLLEAGANPDDGESVYHSCEAESAACLRLLLEHGATIAGTVALPHALDYEHPEHVQLLLDAGADPNEHANVVHAVRRGRGPDTIRLLAQYGADLERPDDDGLTAYRHAVRRNREDVASTLVELGAAPEADELDRALGAVSRGDPPEALPGDLDDDGAEIAILAALFGPTDAIVDLVGVGFHGRVHGSPDGTLLHHAAWVGSPSVVERLLERGADPNARSGAEFDTPLAWAALGSRAHELPGRDYVAVAEHLVAAGAETEPRFADVASGPLADWAGPESTDQP